MNTKIINERPLIEVKKPYDGDDFELYASDLAAAEVGKEWRTENQDCYPNRNAAWEEVFTVVYKNDRGCAVLHTTEGAPDIYTIEELLWVELRR